MGVAREIFAALFSLPFLKYRKYGRALNLCFAVVAVLWTGWCLYWPFQARQQDLREALTEAQESYQVCLQKQFVTAADCRSDRDGYAKLLRNIVAPPGESAYQSFAGKNTRDLIAFMARLCLLPPLIAFALLRLLLEICIFLARVRHEGIRVVR